MRAIKLQQNLGLTVVAALALSACGGGGGSSSSSSAAGATMALSGYPSSPISCTNDNQQAWLRDYMNDQYFWYAQQGTPNASATTMASYLDSLLYKPVDRYSYTQSTAAFTQFFAEGTALGFGYSIGFSDTAQTILQVRVIEPLSPVGLAGLQRGDTIVTIDGFTPAQINAGALAVVSTAGVVRTFVVKNQAGVQRTLTATSATYNLSPVLTSTVLTAGSTKVGYLAYREFISTGATAVAQAIDSFRSAGITELVLDMRYNGGGSVTAARNLASLIGGSALAGKTFVELRFNAKQSASNFSYAFTSNSSTLGTAPLPTLPRIFVLTSSGTASASELVINGLKPFANVVLIGETTYGKPYGFSPRDACGTTYNVVNFDSVNALGVGGYSNGIKANCAVADDVNHALGDPLEARTAAALQYIQTGACPAGTAVASTNLERNVPNASVDRSSSATNSGAFNPALDEARPRGMVAD